MVTEPSPHSSRLSRGCGSLIGCVLVVAIFGMVLGVPVGILVAASTLSPAVQRVVGVILLIDGALVGVSALFFIGLWPGSRRAVRSPRQELAVFLLPQGGWFDVSGTIVSAPVYLAPLSQRPCVIWHIALLHRVYVSGNGDGGGYTRYDVVWRQSRLADVEIMYDQTRTVEVRPGARKDEPTVTVVPAGGTITIPSSIIRLGPLWSSTREFSPTTANLLILDHEGLPAELHEQSARSPDDYEVREFCLTTGDFVRGYQQSTTAFEHGIPDPNAPVEMTSVSQEQISTGAVTSLAVSFIVGMLILLFLGFLLLHSPLPR